MSPLWRDEVAIFLSPRKLALARRARGVRPRVVAATEVAVTTSASGDAGPVLSRLADVLTDRTWHGAAARVVVAGQPWVRYGIVPAPTARLDGEGRITHARYVLGDAFGPQVADWAVTLADAPPGRSCVACAIPASLRTSVEEALVPAGLALLALQPQLVVAFNAWRHRLPADDAWFVTVDEGSLAAVHLGGGAWDRVHMARLSPDWGVELERLQAFDRATRPAGAPGRMLVDAPSWMRRGLEEAPGVEWLEGDDGAQAHELSLLQRMYT